MRIIDELDGHMDRQICIQVIGDWYITICHIKRYTKFTLTEEEA